MKIGIVIWDLTVSGGTQRQVIELARELAKRHEVTTFCYAFDRAKCFPELTDGLDIMAVADKVPAWPAHPGDKLRAFVYDSYRHFLVFDREVRRLADSIPGGFDVVNFHDTFMDRAGYYYKQAHPETRLVWMSNDSPAIFLVLDDARENPRAAAGIKQQLGRWVQRQLYGLAAARGRRHVGAMDAVVVLDGRNKRQVDELMGQQAVVVRSGLAIDNFTPGEKPKSGPFVVLGTGIFFRHRRFEDLIAAAGLLVKAGRKIQLNIIGKPSFEPAYAQELYGLVEQLKLKETVNFLGAVSEEELLRQYRSAGVFVFPNHNQTWGLSVFEAMASGTPVIVSRGAGAHEVLTDGENALLVDSKQPEQIAAAIGRLMDEPKLGEKLSRNGRAFVEREITWELYARNMERVFKGKPVDAKH